MYDKPLVSVVVLAYNASKTITETLDSIYEQNYDNLELIITDDCSSDDTVKIAEKWIEVHADKFQTCVINRQPKNSGVPANLNAGIRKASGKYLKIIAADDLLTFDCILKNVEICIANDYRYLFTWLKKFTVDEKNGKKIWDEEPEMEIFSASAKEQYNILLSGNRVYGCIFFTEKRFVEEIGMYNEEYSLMEDYPMWLKMTRSGYRLNFAPVPTVLYRISDVSLSNFVGDRAVNQRYVECYGKFIKKEVLPPLLKKIRIVMALKHMRTLFYHKLFVFLGNSREKRSVRIAEYFYYKRYLRKNKCSEVVLWK